MHFDNPDKHRRVETTPAASDNGDVGLSRTPNSMPSRDDRVATVSIGDCRLIIGYRWAIYGHIDANGTVTTFKGWKNFSDDTGAAITALEAAAATTVHGAPAITLPEQSESITELEVELTDRLLHVRTQNSDLPSLIPPEYLQFEVDHPANPGDR